MFQQYLKTIHHLLEKIEQEESNVISEVSKRIAHSLTNDGIIYVFGCGHSHMLGEEVFYRAGGLVPINPILIEDLMLHRGASRSSELEKHPTFAKSFLSEINLSKNDLLIVASTSGRNPVPIDVALYGKEQGTHVVGITSLHYKGNQDSRHASGLHLSEAVDTVINNHIEVGDALISFADENIQVGPGSSITGMAIMNSLVVETTNILIENGQTPPVFKSGNVDGGTEHNQTLLNKYKPLIDKL
ncbi:hypothetical protein AJ85_11380 [Alkalihalobacillus alcalophilus ATCC 27647 = CGMCC 1.3604]|uniref:UPF0309 protein AJ85_11380 n=1 Tax=Alkalihalobacillus alcalophilus ATCC 27647 = CGMCC 1.3604 TaxID=1218173 RepID=A0A094WIP3_ALKAL|nr:SIS domain-containing protein [Alkalihalobacillus alcalophilus]KGA97669.1 hypothetical protein BALCAV_0209010 [Alkalihalobacillus alcalophilus ATCC 27647 = CGMCC 1.3604]MED1561297.1 SIS domain-containing protein [Alkalihalobacillus alcalophilus]THG90347.1 hypothetical protein AJ85_11380 [Alkalihalobacillus alcalophilus ATCC 27647 = CGMCC 1.3604]